MLEAFVSFVEKNQLCSKSEKILVAVSGGVDSVVLLNLFQKKGYLFGIAHCNFKLRGEESNLDEIFVRNLAKRYQADFHTKSFNTSTYAQENKCSIQEAARDLRYRFFEELCKSKGYDKVAVAHHIDDQIETFVINLLRGSGLGGLKGMPVKRGKIIRPLLFAKRKEIEDYANDNGLHFREDTSNKSDKYLRNQIRHNLLPDLEKIRTDYRRSINESIQFLSEDHQLINQFIENKKEGLFTYDNNIVKIQIAKLHSEPEQRIILFHLLKEFGFNRDLTNSIADAVENKATGNIFYSNDYQLLMDREFLLIQKIIPENKVDTYLIDSPGKTLKAPITIKTHIDLNFQMKDMIKDPAYAYLDLDKLSFPLVIRKWRKGDRFTPFGMKGSKLVSDSLIDQKIDRFEKEKVYVMESEGEIAWLVGYRIAERFKIEDQTNRVVVAKLIS